MEVVRFALGHCNWAGLESRGCAARAICARTRFTSSGYRDSKLGVSGAIAPKIASDK